MEENKKRGIIQKTRDFLYDHTVEIILGVVGVISTASVISTTNKTNKLLDDNNRRQQEEHDKKMELYDKAKYSDNTNININV